MKSTKNDNSCVSSTLHLLPSYILFPHLVKIVYYMLKSFLENEKKNC